MSQTKNEPRENSLVTNKCDEIRRTILEILQSYKNRLCKKYTFQDVTIDGNNRIKTLPPCNFNGT